ncbi:MAG TPA: copper resistance protein CopC [Longimicrobiales bacterium]|nr:copper resistance protein CopC [Longimicrobiales bacterium]
MDSSVLHARLEASTPAPDDTLVAPLDSVRLEFSAAVSADLTRLLLVGPQGDTTVLSAGQAGDGSVILAPLPLLPPGAHELHWRTTSADGHVLEGTIPFVVGPTAARAMEEPASAAPDSAPVAATGGNVPGAAPEVSEAAPANTPALLPLLRALGTLLLLALAGGLLFASRAEQAAAALLPTLRWLAIAAPIAIAAELVTWTTHVAGSLDLAGSLQLATGRALLARIVFALTAALVLLLLRSMRGAAVVALVAVLAGGSLGHAGAIAPAVSVPLRAVHMAAAAVWLGGLLALGLTLRNTPAQRSLLTAVSTAALASFVVVALTGAGQALLLLGSPAALLQTTYGRIVLVKATGLLLLAAFGYLHRRMIAVVPEGGDASALRRSVTVETLVFIALILVSGALSFAQLPE